MDEKKIIRYIQGKASNADIKDVAEWINKSEDNAVYFSALKARHVFACLPNTVVRSRKNKANVYIRVAAACCLPFLALSIYLALTLADVNAQYAETNTEMEILSTQNTGFVTYTARSGGISTVILPDSSKVYLNSNSRLVAPARFDSESREIYLAGEGYFEVRHHEDWPMYVHTDKGLTAKVLGTTFNLSTYDNDDFLALTLIDGCVHICDGLNEHKCKTGEEMIIPDRKNSDEDPVIKTADIHSNIGWINGELVFKNTPMPEFIKKLERWYGVSVHVEDPSILKYHFTATFSSESISRVMEYVAYSSMIDYDINGSDIYIRHSRDI